MSGFKDSVTGELIMSGSPDITMCLDIDFDILLGKSGKPIVGIKRMKEMCLQYDKKSLLERTEIAEKLILYAQRLFCYPTNIGHTKIENAKKAIEVLGA